MQDAVDISNLEHINYAKFSKLVGWEIKAYKEFVCFAS